MLFMLKMFVNLNCRHTRATSIQDKSNEEFSCNTQESIVVFVRVYYKSIGKRQQIKRFCSRLKETLKQYIAVHYKIFIYVLLRETYCYLNQRAVRHLGLISYLNSVLVTSQQG